MHNAGKHAEIGILSCCRPEESGNICLSSAAVDVLVSHPDAPGCGESSTLRLNHVAVESSHTCMA